MQGGNPLANILVVVVGAIIIAMSIVLGFFAFLALSAVLLVAAVVIGVRGWWIRRTMPDTHEVPRETGGRNGGEFIEGEFHVVKKDKNS
jgi:hypothetical protein